MCQVWERSLDGLKRQADNLEIGGSNPPVPTKGKGA